MAHLSTLWKQLLWDCYHHGYDYTKDDTKVRELLGNYYFIERPQDIGLPFNKKIDNVEEFFTNIKNGLYNLQGYPIKDEALLSYVQSWNDLTQIYCSDEEFLQEAGIEQPPFVYTYPERVLHWSYKGEWVNQLDVVLNRLKNNLGSNRATMTLYHPGLDAERKDIPCLNWLQATVRHQKLELHCIFRSNDLYGAWPANILFITCLGLSIAEELDGVCFNGIHYHSSSLHIYHTDLPAVREVLHE